MMVLREPWVTYGKLTSIIKHAVLPYRNIVHLGIGIGLSSQIVIVSDLLVVIFIVPNQ